MEDDEHRLAAYAKAERLDNVHVLIAFEGKHHPKQNERKRSQQSSHPPLVGHREG
jgi:hypothetical protein